MSISYAPIIKSVNITPNPVTTKSIIRIAVDVESCDYERLTKYTHAELQSFKHIQLSTEIIGNETNTV